VLIREEAAFHDVIKYLHEDLADGDVERTNKVHCNSKKQPR